MLLYKIKRLNMPFSTQKLGRRFFLLLDRLGILSVTFLVIRRDFQQIATELSSVSLLQFWNDF